MSSPAHRVLVVEEDEAAGLAADATSSRRGRQRQLGEVASQAHAGPRRSRMRASSYACIRHPRACTASQPRALRLRAAHALPAARRYRVQRRPERARGGAGIYFA